MRNPPMLISANPWARLVILLMVLVAGAEVTLGQTVQTGPVPVSLRPITVMAASDQMLALGKKVYTKECAPCHGLDGRGAGDAAYLLYPKPRDFVTAQYRLVSTWERVPTDNDLFFSISRGIPASAMPSWAHLPEETRWALVYYIKSFAQRPIQPKTSESEGETGIVKVAPEPSYTVEAQELAKGYFHDACASSHGETGRGDGVQEQFDEKGISNTSQRFGSRDIQGRPPNELEIYYGIIVEMSGSPQAHE